MGFMQSTAISFVAALLLVAPPSQASAIAVRTGDALKRALGECRCWGTVTAKGREQGFAFDGHWLAVPFSEGCDKEGTKREALRAALAYEMGFPEMRRLVLLDLLHPVGHWGNPFKNGLQLAETLPEGSTTRSIILDKLKEVIPRAAERIVIPREIKKISVKPGTEPGLDWKEASWPIDESKRVKWHEWRGSDGKTHVSPLPIPRAFLNKKTGQKHADHVDVYALVKVMISLVPPGDFSKKQGNGPSINEVMGALENAYLDPADTEHASSLEQKVDRAAHLWFHAPSYLALWRQKRGQSIAPVKEAFFRNEMRRLDDYVKELSNKSQGIDFSLYAHLLENLGELLSAEAKDGLTWSSAELALVDRAFSAFGERALELIARTQLPGAETCVSIVELSHAYTGYSAYLARKSPRP